MTDQNRAVPWRGGHLQGPVGIALLVLAGCALLGVLLSATENRSASVAMAADQPLILSSTTVTHTLFFPYVSMDYPCVPLDGVTLSGPQTGSLGQILAFGAATGPVGARQPITYTWQAEGQAPVVHVGGAQDTATFNWTLAGSQAITVEAANVCGQAVSDTLVTSITTRGLIAFERHYCAEPGNDESCEPHDIWLRHHDGTGIEINLTNTPEIDEGVPTWSPDGNWIAYSAGPPTGNRALYKIDLRTRQVTALTDGTSNDRWPAWSPLGGRIAFMRSPSGISPHPDIYVMDTDGSNLFQLTDWLYGDDFPAWSPDGQWIVFSSDRFYAGRDLYIVHPNNPASAQIVLQTDRPGGDDRRDEIYPAWSPDGWIYHTFVYRDYPADKTEYLYRIKPNGTERAKVFNDAYERYIPSFAPAGDCFVFYSTLGGWGGVDKEVWKWCNGYTTPFNLTNNGDNFGDEFCAWSPAP